MDVGTRGPPCTAPPPPSVYFTRTTIEEPCLFFSQNSFKRVLDSGAKENPKNYRGSKLVPLVRLFDTFGYLSSFVYFLSVFFCLLFFSFLFLETKLMSFYIGIVLEDNYMFGRFISTSEVSCWQCLATCIDFCFLSACHQ